MINLCLRKSRWCFVVFLLIFPVLLTWIYFSLGENYPLFQKITYVILKTIQFLLPICWTTFILKQAWHVRTCNRHGLSEGFIWGLIVFIGIILFYLNLRNVSTFASSFIKFQDTLLVRFDRLKMNTPFIFILLGIFYSIIHSGLEEYYWRWFAFRELHSLIKPKTSTSFPVLPALLSSLCFTLHHIIILSTFFGFNSFITWVCVFGVFVGGIYWCWLYYRSNSILGPWLAHGLVDSALFVVGYIVLFRLI